MKTYKPKNENAIIPIQACWGPYGNKQAYQEYAEAGFNWVYLDTDNGSNPRTNLKELLEWCDEFGLGAIVISFYQPLDESEIRYGDYACFTGVTFGDEPIFDQVEEITASALDLEKRYPGKISYLNLAPTYWHPELFAKFHSDRGMQREYLRIYSDEFLDKLSGVKIFSMDYYPLLETENGNKKLAKDWLLQLETCALICRQKKYDFHFYLQTAGGWDSDFALYGGRSIPPQCVEDLRMQVSVCFAYGVKGFHYFTYRPMPGCRYGTLSDINGKTAMWEFAKQVNAEIKKFAPIVLSFDWIRTGLYNGTKFHSVEAEDAYRQVEMNDKRFYKLKDVVPSNDLVVGEYIDENGNYGYMLANYTLDEKAVNYISFRALGKVIAYRNGEVEELVEKDGQYAVELANGDGLFVIVEEDN